MKTYKFKQVDAFTSKPFGGNYAGVVLDASGMTEQQMQSVAAEMNLPETAFILPPSTKQADVQIRWFTPRYEVPLCGHATIAGFHALAEEEMAGMKTQGQHYFRLQTKSGILRVRVEKNFRGTNVEFELPLPKFKKRNLGIDALKTLGLHSRDIDTRLPIVSDLYLYIPMRKLAKLYSLHPDAKGISVVSRKTNVLGICLFTLETVEKESAVHSRFFAPAMGVDEDPVTGSANGPLGVYLKHYAEPEGISIESRSLVDGRTEYIGEQGDCLGRPGRVRIRVKTNDGDIASVAICGEAITVLNGTLSI
ncbi:MAG: PhzF family phenazine biosynthesis protein [Ignavibacteriales bacterium]|nr:PhzF family phenazine biosynthesis protein [Ignavibacteriales bacterium]